MSGYIELKWRSHSSTFLENLSHLRDQQIYTDVTISCGNKFYPAHRLVLSTCSNFFARSLQIVNTESPVLLLHGIEEFILEQLLMFMYDGQVTIMQNDLPSFLQAARWLGMKGLDVSHGGSEESRAVGRQGESAKYFSLWSQILSPLVSSDEEQPSYDEMTAALRQVIGRFENENTVKSLVVSNVTSLSTQVPPECHHMDEDVIVENIFQAERSVKNEIPDSSMDEDIDNLRNSSNNMTDVGNNSSNSLMSVADSTLKTNSQSPKNASSLHDNALESDDSLDSDNNFEGWEDGTTGFRDRLKSLQSIQLNLSNSIDERELSPGASSYASSYGNSIGEDCVNGETPMKRSLRCKQCKTSFTVREELAEHLRNHGHNFCYDCGKGFVSTSRFKMHMRLHESRTQHQCTDCEFISHSKRGLSIHYAVMHGDVSFRKEEEEEENHLIEIDSSQGESKVALLTCNLCGFRSNYLRGFKRHVTCKHSKRKWSEVNGRHVEVESVDNSPSCSLFRCNLCDFSSTSKTGFKNHVTYKHSKNQCEKIQEPQKKIVLKGQYEYPQEQEVLKGQYEELQKQNTLKGRNEESQEQEVLMSQHEDPQNQKILKGQYEEPQRQELLPVESPVSKFCCNICSFTSIHKRGFRKHMSCVHNVTDIDQEVINHGCLAHGQENAKKIGLRSQRNSYECSQCQRKFDSYRLFTKHVTYRCGRYKCKYCHKMFGASERYAYLNHLKVHGEKHFKCDYCSYKTSSKRSLEDHQLTHSYYFSCHLCPYQCFYQHHLTSHILQVHGQSQDVNVQDKDGELVAIGAENSGEQNKKSDSHMEDRSKAENSGDQNKKSDSHMEDRSKAENSEDQNKKSDSHMEDRSKAENSGDQNKKSDSHMEDRSKAENSEDQNKKSDSHMEDRSKAENSGDQNKKSDSHSEDRSKAENSGDQNKKSDSHMEDRSKVENSGDQNKKSDSHNEDRSKAENSGDQNTKSDSHIEDRSVAENSGDQNKESDSHIEDRSKVENSGEQNMKSDSHIGDRNETESSEEPDKQSYSHVEDRSEESDTDITSDGEESEGDL